MKWSNIFWIILLVIGGAWFVRYITTPPPGAVVEDQGREHVSAEEVAKTVYKSNPPTSGPHLETWVKPGIYTEPLKEGELIHSLEHGYININYNCDKETEDCKILVSQLEDIANKKGLKKLLIVPRPQLDTKIALTAWNRIDKFNDFDATRIEKFIDYWRDHGPEQTME